MLTYKNPWHKPHVAHTGPAFYSPHPTAPIFEHRGYTVVERIEGHIWDVVKDGACITQRAGKDGAKRAIDDLLDIAVPA